MGARRAVAAADARHQLYRTMAEKLPFDREDYVRQLAELPGDWPPAEDLGLR